IGATLTPPGGAQPWWVVHCWILAYLSLGAAFGHPSGQRLGVEVTGTGALTARRLVFLGAALGLNPLLAAALVVVGGEPDPLLLAVGSLAVTPLVLHRIMLLARMHASAEQRLRRLATHDELTGLPNRRAAIARLDAILDGLAAGTSPGAAVLFLDLDEFKQVNDGYGHQMGDRLLVEVARRLRGAIRSTDLVARFGGDEFVLVLEGDPDAARSAGVASVEHVLEPPVLLDGLLASARASIGTTELRTGDRLTAEEVLAAADTAMYRVKWSRRERDAEPGRRSSGSLA
ncbi:MAG TPA: GGDEF domain-containing protein, partial [Actinotalea sp.]|nr:GGDEF domain-containing protein [Actinotalea sp.]